MRRVLLFLASLLFLPYVGVCLAQVIVPSPPGTLKLGWDHPGTNVDKFLLCVDAQPCSDVGLPLLTGQTATNPTDKVYGVPWPAMPPGVHSLVVKTSFQGVEQSSTVLSATMVVVTAPTNLRTIKEP